MTTLSYISIVLLTFQGFLSNAQNKSDTPFTVGPDSGSLLIVGGALKDEHIFNRFIELAGGVDAPIVVIPTAGGKQNYSQNAGNANTFRALGATNVVVVHTNDKTEANSEAFIKPLRLAKGIWFSGGRQWRLVDAYKNTKTEEMFKQVLARGGVIGGSSAGATIQGSYLARGDTKNNQIMMGDHEHGFGFIKNIAIDQHVLARNRQFDLFNILKKKPELLGIGIDENTAIEVHGNEFTVLGATYVLVYDGHFWSREGSDLKTIPPADRRFYFLRKGDRYNMKERKVIETNH